MNALMKATRGVAAMLAVLLLVPVVTGWPFLLAMRADGGTAEALRVVGAVWLLALVGAGTAIGVRKDRARAR